MIIVFQNVVGAAAANVTVVLCVVGVISVLVAVVLDNISCVTVGVVDADFVTVLAVVTLDVIISVAAVDVVVSVVISRVEY
jgi:hypothetical protein